MQLIQDQIEDSGWLTRLIALTEKELPEPKPKPKEKDYSTGTPRRPGRQSRVLPP